MSGKPRLPTLVCTGDNTQVSESSAALMNICDLQHGLPSPGSGLGLAQQAQALLQPLAQQQLDLNHGSCHLVCKIPLYRIRDSIVYRACYVAQATRISKL